MLKLSPIILGLAVCGALGVSSVRAQEWISFPSNDSQLTGGVPTNINGALYRPQNADKAPAVIFLHGCEGLYQTFGIVSRRYEQWARDLVDSGYVVLLVDSFTPRGIT